MKDLISISQAAVLGFENEGFGLSLVIDIRETENSRRAKKLRSKLSIRTQFYAASITIVKNMCTVDGETRLTAVSSRVVLKWSY